MSSSRVQRPLGVNATEHSGDVELQKLNEALSNQKYLAGFHGDALIGVSP